MNRSLKFIRLFDESLKVYQDFKKDFLCVDVLYMNFIKENKNISDELKKAKLNKLVNTYSIQKNHKFKMDTYNKCKLVWTELDQYLETNIWLVVNALEDTNNINARADANQYYENINNVISTLGLEKINIYGNSIMNILQSLRTQIGLS